MTRSHEEWVPPLPETKGGTRETAREIAEGMSDSELAESLRRFDAELDHERTRVLSIAREAVKTELLRRAEKKALTDALTPKKGKDKS